MIGIHIGCPDEEDTFSKPKIVREHVRVCGEVVPAGDSRDLASFVELCEAQHKMKAAAAASPVEMHPTTAALMTTEAARVVLLCFVNLFMLCGTLPPRWCFIPILPITRPGKPADLLESHRPISLMAAVMKLIDKILFARVWAPIRRVIHGWQGGGHPGS